MIFLNYKYMATGIKVTILYFAEDWRLVGKGAAVTKPGSAASGIPLPSSLS